MSDHVELQHIGGALRALRESADVGLREQARRMAITHPRLGRIESQPADLRIGTIASYVAALGGELALTVRMPDGRTVDLLEAADEGTG